MRPRVVVIGGLPGSGKSTTIAALRKLFPASVSIDLAETQAHRLVMSLREARVAHWRGSTIEGMAARRFVESIALATVFRRGFAPPQKCPKIFVELVSPVDILADIGDFRLRLVPPSGIVEEQLMQREGLSGASVAWLHTMHTLCANAVLVPAAVKIVDDVANAVEWVKSVLEAEATCFA